MQNSPVFRGVRTGSGSRGGTASDIGAKYARPPWLPVMLVIILVNAKTAYCAAALRQVRRFSSRLA